MVGIYKITNNLNNACYIGQSVNLEHRLCEHLRLEGYSHIHNAIKKYGIENFSFEIIEECDKDVLDNREIYWINYYNSFKHGYNEAPGGKAFPWGTTRVDCFNLDGDRVGIYDSLEEAAAATEADPSKISKCIHFKAHTAGGFQWRFHNDLNYFIDCFEPDTYNKIGINKYTLDGTYLETFKSLSEASQNIYGKNNGNVRRNIKFACENEAEAYNFKWKIHERSATARLADKLND